MLKTEYYNPSSPIFKPVPVMLPEEFARSIRQLGMDQTRAAERLGLSLRQIQHYIYGTRKVAGGKEVPVPVPQPTAMLLRLMLRHGIQPKELS